MAIDDAGAGFASLRHILLIDPEMIKLDVSLTLGIESDPRAGRWPRRSISFADEMGIEVVAEGIETEQQLEALHELGVRYGQGYFLGRGREAARRRELVRAPVHRPGRPGRGLGEGLHLGGDRDGFRVVREGPPVARRDADRDREERELLLLPLTAHQQDVAAVAILGS